MTWQRFWIIGLAVLSVQACTPGQPIESNAAGSNPFVGAWRIAQTTLTDAAGTTTVDDAPSTGLYIFTQRHFSTMLIPGPERAPFFFKEQQTDEERLNAYDNFSADAGTYEYDQTTLTTTNMIAKIPDVMRFALTYEWRLDRDDLILTFRGAWAPAGGEITYRLSRLE